MKRPRRISNAECLPLPAGSSADDLWCFLISGGKVERKEETTLTQSKALESAVKDYLDSYAEGSKEASTLDTERIHLSHFVRILGKRKSVNTIDAQAVESFVQKRLKEKGLRGKKVSATTVKKELATFSLFWKHCSIWSSPLKLIQRE